MSAANLTSKAPYLGLRPFEADDSRFFFGRTREVELLAANLRTSRASLVYGESGVGKSSLIRAGLLPWLSHESASSLMAEHEEESFVPVVISLSAQPLDAALAKALLRAVAPPDYGERWSLVQAIEFVLHRRNRILIVLDQFEEFLAYGEQNDGYETASELLRMMATVDLPVHVMITIREDAVSRLDRLGRRARDFISSPIRIEPLSEDAAREAIQGPLRVYNEIYGSSWDAKEDFIDAVIQATRIGSVDLGIGGRGGLKSGVMRPIEAAYLQIVLKRVWDAEVQAGTESLSIETFTKLGAVEGIVRAHLDEALSGLSETDQALAADAFRYLVTPSGMKVPYAPGDLADFMKKDVKQVEHVLKELASPNIRIVRTLPPSPRGDVRYEIYHDRLADPILDWRVRRQRGGDRTRQTRFVAGFTAMTALLAAVISLGVGTRSSLTLTLVGLATVYLIFSLFPRFVTDAVEIYVERLNRIWLSRRRLNKHDRNNDATGNGNS